MKFSVCSANLFSHKHELSKCTYISLTKLIYRINDIKYLKENV